MQYRVHVAPARTLIQVLTVVDVLICCTCPCNSPLLVRDVSADGIPAEQYFEQVYGSAEFMRQGAKRLQHAGMH